MKRFWTALCVALTLLVAVPVARSTPGADLLLFAAKALGFGQIVQGGTPGACLTIGKNSVLTQSACNSTSFSGNGLVNFSNPALTTNSHKKILMVGNSTIWNATGYFTEFCQYMNTSVFGNGNVFGQLNLTPCTTSVSSYTVNNATGSITVNFTGSAPTGYAVGDLISSEPTLSALSSLVGTGVITSIGATSITYQLLPTNPFPSATGTTSSGGYVSNSLLNLGVNGAQSTNINSTVTPLLAQYAFAGDLVLVRGPLINDVRQGACNLACATANVSALYNAIVAAIPATVDIVWKTENSLLTTDPTSSGYVSPLASSAAYTKILHDAVFEAFAALPSRAVVWDNMQIVFTKLGGEYATSAWMTDILHPNGAGQTREADADAQILAQIITGKGFTLAKLSNPNANTATNGTGLNGDLTWLDALRAQVGFSQFMTEHAQVNNYAAPWTLYPDSVLDPSRYDVVAYGQATANGANATYVRFSNPTVNGASISSQKILPGDLIWSLGNPVVQIPIGVGATAFNSGGSVYTLQISNLGAIVPALYANQPVVILRQHSYVLSDVPKYQDSITWSYRHRINITASGTNFLRVLFEDTSVSWPTAITSADYLELPCGEVPLAGASFSNFSTYMQINLTGSWGSCGGQTGWVFGTHPMETNAALVTSAGAVKTGGYTVATLPTGVVGMRAYVTDQTTACPSVGGALTGGGAITCPVFYNGSAWVGD